MLYAKIDDAGNPVEVAKNYAEINKEFLSKGSIIPSESVFGSKPTSFGYAPVPFNEPPPSQAGKKITPDIPVKKSDGTYERTWKQVDVDEVDKKQMDIVMRSRRQEVLKQYIDGISPVRWNNMNDQDKAEVNAFYKSILDMPEDPAWPFVTFPIRPNCLR